MNNKFLLVFIAIALLLFTFGCTGQDDFVLPYTTSQLIAQSTDLNYTLFKQGFYDGNCLGLDNNLLTVFDCNTGGGGSNSWNDLTDFPSECGENQAVRIIGTTLTCVDLPVDTNVYTAGILSSDNNSVLIDLNLGGNNIFNVGDVNATRFFGDGSGLTGISTLDTNFETAGYGDLNMDLNYLQNGDNISELFNDSGYITSYLDTNAETACSSGQYLDGNGGCYDVNGLGGDGSSVPAGSDTQIQFNRNNNLFASSNLVYNYANGYLVLDGSGDYVGLGTNSNLKPDELTISAWVKTTTGGRILASWKNNTGALNIRRYVFNERGLLLRDSSDSSNSTINFSASNISTIRNGAWHHIVVTTDGTVSGTKLYLDGTEETSYSITDNGDGWYNDKTAYVTMGALLPDSGFFEGNLDEVMVFNRELSSSEINDIYTNDRDGSYTVSGLVSKWNFDDGTADDGVGSNDGTLQDDAYITGTDAYWQVSASDMYLNSDTKKHYFGVGQDASIGYDGTDLVIDPDVVGSGRVKIDGNILMQSPNGNWWNCGVDNTGDFSCS